MRYFLLPAQCVLLSANFHLWWTYYVRLVHSGATHPFPNMMSDCLIVSLRRSSEGHQLRAFRAEKITMAVVDIFFSNIIVILFKVL